MRTDARRLATGDCDFAANRAFRMARYAKAAAAFAAVAWRARTVDLSGAIGGLVLGSAVWSFGGWEAFALLGAFFILGSGATRYRMEEKLRMGLAQEKVVNVYNWNDYIDAFQNCPWCNSMQTQY